MPQQKSPNMIEYKTAERAGSVFPSEVDFSVHTLPRYLTSKHRYLYLVSPQNKHPSPAYYSLSTVMFLSSLDSFSLVADGGLAS